MSTKNFQVTGMTCSHCEMSVREEVGELAGVESIAVSAESGSLAVTTSAEVADTAILAAVEEAGYTATRV